MVLDAEVALPGMGNSKWKIRAIDPVTTLKIRFF